MAELLCNLVMEILKNIPWLFVFLIVHTVYEHQPKSFEVQFKDFILKSKH
nr:MAG TPA: hypothetical protein [Caudoviricetes sp.]